MDPVQIIANIYTGSFFERYIFHENFLLYNFDKLAKNIFGFGLFPRSSGSNFRKFEISLEVGVALFGFPRLHLVILLHLGVIVSLGKRQIQIQ